MVLRAWLIPTYDGTASNVLVLARPWAGNIECKVDLVYSNVLVYAHGIAANWLCVTSTLRDRTHTSNEASYVVVVLTVVVIVVPGAGPRSIS